MGPLTQEAIVCEEAKRTWCRIVLYSDFTRSIEEAARIGAASTDLLVRMRHQWLGGVTRQACSTAILRGRLRAVHTTELQEPPSNADIWTLLRVSNNAINSRLTAPHHLQRDIYR